MRGPIELLTASFELFKNHWKLFLGIFAIPGLVTAIVDYYSATHPVSNVYGAEYPLPMIVVSIIMVLALFAMQIALSKAVSAPNETTIKSAYQFAQKYFLQYILLSIMVGFVILLGTLALIIPGIIFAVWFGFSYFVLIFEGKKGVDAMKASKAYVKGHWWAIVGRIVVLMFVMIALSIITGIGGKILGMVFPHAILIAVVSFVTSFVAMPIAIAYAYFMYVDLKKVNAVSPAIAVVSSPENQPQTPAPVNAETV